MFVKKRLGYVVERSSTLVTRKVSHGRVNSKSVHAGKFQAGKCCHDNKEREHKFGFLKLNKLSLYMFEPVHVELFKAFNEKNPQNAQVGLKFIKGMILKIVDTGTCDLA